MKGPCRHVSYLRWMPSLFASTPRVHNFVKEKRERGKVAPIPGCDAPSNEVHTQDTFDTSLSSGEKQNVLGQIIYAIRRKKSLEDI